MSARQFRHFVQTTKTTQPRPQVSSGNGSIWRFNTTNYWTDDVILTSSVQYDSSATGDGELCVWFYPIRNGKYFEWIIKIILHPTVVIYDFHVFITSSSSFHRFNMNQFNDLLPVGLLARILVERQEFKSHTSLTFFRLPFRNYKRCLNICDDFLSYKSFCTTDTNAGCPKFHRFQTK